MSKRTTNLTRARQLARGARTASELVDALVEARRAAEHDGRPKRFGRIVETVETDNGVTFVVEFDTPEKRRRAEEMAARLDGYFLAMDGILTDVWLDKPDE